jgi:catechol 2,3-dioxygenase-like lactoylglutathione lyase family enzyme
MDRSLAFYTRVLSFEPVSDVEVTGSEYEHLQGVFGLHTRAVFEHGSRTFAIACRGPRATPPTGGMTGLGA